MSPGSDDDGREGVGKGEPDDLELPTVVVDPRSQNPRAEDLRTKVTPRVPRAYVTRTPSTPPTVSLPPPSADGPAPEEGADLASALEPHLAWLAEPQRSELFLVLLKGQFALALNALQEQAARFPRNVSIVRAMQMVERVAIHHIIGKLRPLDRIPVLAERAQVKRVTPAVSELLQLCDGVASLEEILRRARTPRLATLQILQGLVERGGIVLSRPRHRALLEEEMEEPRASAPVTLPPLPLSERGLSAESEEVLGRATFPDPVEARYQAALMPPPSGPLRRATLRGMPPVTPPPTDVAGDTPTPLVMPPPVIGKVVGNDAPTARPPPMVREAIVRSALISIPNLELPASEQATPDEPEVAHQTAPSLTEEPTILPLAPETEPPISSIRFDAVGRRPARGVGIGLGLVVVALGAVGIGVAIRAVSDPDPVPLAAVGPPAAAAANDRAAGAERETIRLTVEISPNHASVTLDGGALLAPYRRELPRADAEHTIEVAARGYKSRTATFRATGDASIIIALEPLPPKKAFPKSVGQEPPAPPPEASVEVPPPPPEDIDPYEE